MNEIPLVLGPPQRCAYVHAQSRPTLRHPMDCSPPGSSIHGILQEIILEGAAISFSMLCIYISKTSNLIVSYPVNMHVKN